MKTITTTNVFNMIISKSKIIDTFFSLPFDCTNERVRRAAEKLGIDSDVVDGVIQETRKANHEQSKTSS